MTVIQDKDIARKINIILIDVARILDQSVILVKDNCSDEEFINYRRRIGIIMGEMLLEIMNQIYKQHPDLEPESFK
jgi:hypothetical protein